MAAAADLERRVHRARLRRLGMSEGEYATARNVAGRAWCARPGFRWLPRAVSLRLCARFGRNWRARFIRRLAERRP